MSVTKEVHKFGNNLVEIYVYMDEQGVCFLISHAMANGDTNGMFHALGERNFGPAKTKESFRVTHGRLVVCNEIYEPGETMVVNIDEQIVIEPLVVGTSYVCHYGE